MSQKGFSQIILLGIVAVVILVGAGSFSVFQGKQAPAPEKTAQPEEVSPQSAISPAEQTPPQAQSVPPPKPKTEPASKPKPPPPAQSAPPAPQPLPPKPQVARPVLKNLGISIEAWNKETNRAGDFTFTKKLVFNDGFINNEKVFAEFGAFEHEINNPSRSIEYWFFLSPGTKVRAPVDGVAGLSFIEHTKDWGVNIKIPQSEFIVSFEHLMNLTVKNGDTVKAGDVIGDAAPRNFFGENLSFTELAVWTGGRGGIFKYCPFDFLDDPLKPLYEAKLNQLTKDWEEFIGKDVHKQEDWVAPGCLLDKIQER